MDAVWGRDVEVPRTSDELARVIYEVRRRLGRGAGEAAVETVRGLGYRLLTCG